MKDKLLSQNPIILIDYFLKFICICRYKLRNVIFSQTINNQDFKDDFKE